MKAMIEIVRLSSDIVTASDNQEVCSIPGMTTDCPTDGF